MSNNSTFKDGSVPSLGVVVWGFFLNLWRTTVKCYLATKPTSLGAAAAENDRKRDDLCVGSMGIRPDC